MIVDIDAFQIVDLTKKYLRSKVPTILQFLGYNLAEIVDIRQCYNCDSKFQKPIFYRTHKNDRNYKPITTMSFFKYIVFYKKAHRTIVDIL